MGRKETAEIVYSLLMDLDTETAVEVLLDYHGRELIEDSGFLEHLINEGLGGDYELCGQCEEVLHINEMSEVSEKRDKFICQSCAAELNNELNSELNNK